MHFTLKIFQTYYYTTKNNCLVQMLGILFGKISWSQMISKRLIRREMGKNISAEDRGSAAVSSQFLIVHFKCNCHAKSQCY